MKNAFIFHYICYFTEKKYRNHHKSTDGGRVAESEVKHPTPSFQNLPTSTFRKFQLPTPTPFNEVCQLAKKRAKIIRAKINWQRNEVNLIILEISMLLLSVDT